MKHHTITGGGGSRLHVVEAGDPRGPSILFLPRLLTELAHLGPAAAFRARAPLPPPSPWTCVATARGAASRWL